MSLQELQVRAEKDAYYSRRTDEIGKNPSFNLPAIEKWIYLQDLGMTKLMSDSEGIAFQTAEGTPGHIDKWGTVTWTKEK